MSEKSSKFNPAVLPAEFMKSFEHADAERAAALSLSRASVRDPRSDHDLDHSRILRGRLSLGPAQESGRNEPLSFA